MNSRLALEEVHLLIQIFGKQILKFILPSLMESIDTTNSDWRVQCLKFLSEIATLYLDKQEPIDEDVRKLLRTYIETSFIELLDLLHFFASPWA